MNTNPAPTPPMGWNSFDSYGCAATADDLLANLEVMADRFKSAGYEYFVVDNGWFAEYQIPAGGKYPVERHAADVRIDEYGRLQPSRVNFPEGLRPIIERTHELGLKFGIHVMRGIPRKSVEANMPIMGTAYTARQIADTSSICSWCEYNYGVDATKPGAQEFYDSWMGMLAEWGVDFIKADDITEFPAEIELLANAIEKSGRAMVLSLSPGNKTNPAHLEAYRRAEMLRVTADIWDNRTGLEKCFDAWMRWADYARPGFWIDLDMIPFGRLQVWNPKPANVPQYTAEEAALAGEGYERLCRLTLDQQQTFVAMRALAASPLFMGGELPGLDETSYSLLTNPDMIACNQNGITGKCVTEIDGIAVFKTPHRTAESSGWLGIFNRTQSRRHGTLQREDVGLAELQYDVVDVWRGRLSCLGEKGLSYDLPSDGCLFLRYYLAGI